MPELFVKQAQQNIAFLGTVVVYSFLKTTAVSKFCFISPFGTTKLSIFTIVDKKRTFHSWIMSVVQFPSNQLLKIAC